ncbi:MAG TPA: TIM barrel protein [Candidatus Acidoferrales bacterium]|nr:TIM barrel protein [Candidatus Acidoferrales bacterium]
MKLAVASSAFHRILESGELTQLEFLDLCARDLACDGVVLDVRHFPRTDGDYLAQVKKMAADRGLGIAAVADAGFFAGDETAMRSSLERAGALGAPLLAAPLPLETSGPWIEQLERLGTATSLAKRANVTLALRNAPGTFAATAHDCKRVSKETDSAWLRFGLDPLALDTASDPAALAPNAVLLWSDLDAGASAIASALATFAAFRGYLALDGRDGSASAAEMQSAMRSWRIALAEKELNRT